ncbi:MAG: hypothetical protein MET45_06590 [Nostoc sp. LLA-1]|nr:hypothetical protein [Cyanocohniella sp. LLY]
MSERLSAAPEAIAHPIGKLLGLDKSSLPTIHFRRSPSYTEFNFDISKYLKS